MLCPFCQTENREDRERCYHCDKDISMLRLVTNKARHHYNVALEHAERGRLNEAIDELHNALDLDRRFTNAHVVLGTLHAKQGHFEQARESWNAALQLQPDLAKAHQYLHRVEVVEKSLPAIRRLRIAAVVLLGGVVLLGLSLFYSAREPASVSRLREAQALLQSRNYGEALQRLSAVQAKARRGSAEYTAASALQQALESELRAEVRRIQELKYREEYPEVLAALADLEARHPDAVTSAALVNIREDVNHYYLGQLRRLFADYESGGVTYTAFNEKAREFFQAYPEIPEKRAIGAYLERAAELEAQRRLAAIREDYEISGDPEPVLQGLRELQGQLGGTQAVAEGRSQLVDYLLSTMFDEFHGLVAEQNFAEAEAQLQAIDQISGEFEDVVDVSGPLSLARGVLADLWTGARLKEAEQLVRSGDPGEAREALLLLASEEDTLTTPARELVIELERELDRRSDQQELASLRERRGQLMSGKLEPGDATATLLLAESLVRYLENPKERAEVLAYAAAAAVAAQDRARAADLAAQARREGTLDADLSEQLQKLLKKPSPDLDRRPDPKTEKREPKKPAPKPDAKKTPGTAQEGGRREGAPQPTPAPRRTRVPQETR